MKEKQNKKNETTGKGMTEQRTKELNKTKNNKKE